MNWDKHIWRSRAALLSGGGCGSKWFVLHCRNCVIAGDSFGQSLVEHFTAHQPLRDGDTVIVNRTALAVASDSINVMGQPLTSVTTCSP